MSPTQDRIREQLRDILFRAAGGISDMADKEIDEIIELFTAELEKARINGIIEGLTNFAQLDRKSFRVNSSIMSIDCKDIVGMIAGYMEDLATLQQSNTKLEED